MCPMYDFECKSCGETHTEKLEFAEYDELDTAECEHCGSPLTKADRIIGKGLKTIVHGVSKGNYNSRDYT